MAGGRRPQGQAATVLLRALDAGPLAPDEAAARCGLGARQVANAARVLRRLGYLEVPEGLRLALTAAGRAAASSGQSVTGGPTGCARTPRDTLRERAWAAMRVRRCFTIGEIVADAQRGDEGRPHDNIARYLARLAQAGVVAEDRRRVPGTAPSSNGFKRFRLVRNLGPRAPVFRAGARAVRDPNSGEDLPCARP